MSLGENTSRLVFIVNKETRQTIEDIAAEQNKSIASATSEILVNAMNERMRNEKRLYFSGKK